MIQEDSNTVLASYEDAIAAAGPGGANLAAFVDAHSAYAKEIIEYAANSYVFERGAIYNAELATPEAETAFLAKASEIRARLMAAEGTEQRFESPAPTSLSEAARQRGLTTPALAQRLRLSPLEVVKLNQRLFRPASIPAALIQRLAEALDRTVETISSYLRLPPTLSAQASYKADAAPRMTEQSDFEEAVESSRSLSEEDKTFWRAQARDRAGEMES